MDMRRQIASVICVLLFAGSALALTTRAWTVQTDTTEAILNGVSFASLNNGWAVGDGGAILKTTNSGYAWTSEAVTPTISDNLNDVFMINSGEGWAVGDKLRLVHYTGGSWTASKISNPSDIDLTGVFMTGTGTIFASAGPNFGGSPSNFYNIFSSKDGGATWDKANLLNASDPAGSDDIMQSVFFVNPQVGYACGYNDSSFNGKIFCTTNEGASWADISPTLPISLTLNDIAFLNTAEGWCVGTDSLSPSNGYVFHTLDGGATWLQQYNAPTAGFRRIAAASTADAWVASDQGLIYRFDGTSWARDLDPGTIEYFTSLDFIDRFNGWAVGGARLGGPLRNTYKYVVDPHELKVDKTVYISSTTNDAYYVSVSGNNIQPDATLTIEAASGLVVATYEVAYNQLLAANKINVTLVVDPNSAEAGTYSVYVANPTDRTRGTARINVLSSPSPVQKPTAVPLPQKVFNPTVDNSVNIQVATPGQLTASGLQVGGKPRAAGVVGTYDSVKDVELELIVYDFNTNQIAYRQKFKADPTGYKVVTLSKITDLGLNISEGVYTAVVIHPTFGKIGSGNLVVNYHH
jgi:photosystem II stability/assembly factor-like uncharacterized protein